MNAKVLPEIELNNDIESNIQILKFDDLPCNFLQFECPICFETVSYDIKDITYTSQCDSGKHYLCNDCNTKYIKTCNESRKNHICVICKNLIKKYVEEENEINQLPNIDEIRRRMREINISNNQINDSLPFIFKLLIFDFSFIVITLIIMGNMHLSEQTKRTIYVMYGFFAFCTLLCCCITEQSNVRIMP